MPLIHEFLENGVEVVLNENHFAPTVAIQCWVGVGSLSEGPTERGMAHFIEHMLFKGTERRGVGEIAAAVENSGGEINAYTTFDHTVFHLTLAAPHAELGVDLLCDAFAESRFDPEEFEREREVILEEVRRGNDSPGARIGRRVFELAFAGTEAGRPIIGSEESVRSFTRDSLFKFYKRWYQPSNLTIVIVGDIDAKAILTQLKQGFGQLPAGTTPDARPLKLDTMKTREDYPQVSIIRGDFQQPRLEIVFPAPSLEHFDSTALDLAAFALGSGEMSRLNRRLRDGEGVVTTIGASVYSPLFGGLMEISALTSEDLLLDAARGLAREIGLLGASEPVTAEELSRAQANLKADRLFRDETVEGQARTLGFGLRTPQKLLYDEVYTTLVNQMPLSAVAGAVDRWLVPEASTLVLLVPEKSMLTEDAVRVAFRAGLADATRAKAAAPDRSRARRSTRQSGEAEVFQLKAGVKLVYRYNPNVELFTVTAATEGGLRAESASDAGIANAMSGLFATSSTTRSFEQLMQDVEGRGASLEGFSGKDSLGFHLQCLTEHAEPMLELFRDCAMHPVFPTEQWQSMKRELEQAIVSQNDSPASICVRRFQEAIFGQHPYRYPVMGTAEVLADLTEQKLLDRFRAERDGGPWVFAVASTKAAGEVKDLLEKALDGFNPKAERRHFSSQKRLLGAQAGRQVIDKDREQSHIVYGFPGLTWADPERAALDVLVNVLGGHGGRLFRELRDKDSLAYTVSPIVSYGCDPGLVGSYIACAPAKAEQALAGLKHEMLALGKVEPTAAELDRARNYIIGTHDLGMQKSDAQTSTMALMELYGYGYDDFLSYPKAIAKVKAEDVRRMADRLFKPEWAVEVLVGPGLLC